MLHNEQVGNASRDGGMRKMCSQHVEYSGRGSKSVFVSVFTKTQKHVNTRNCDNVEHELLSLLTWMTYIQSKQPITDII